MNKIINFVYKILIPFRKFLTLSIYHVIFKKHCRIVDVYHKKNGIILWIKNKILYINFSSRNPRDYEGCHFCLIFCDGDFHYFTYSIVEKIDENIKISQKRKNKVYYTIKLLKNYNRTKIMYETNQAILRAITIYINNLAKNKPNFFMNT